MREAVLATKLNRNIKEISIGNRKTSNQPGRAMTIRHDNKAAKLGKKGWCWGIWVVDVSSRVEIRKELPKVRSLVY